MVDADRLEAKPVGVIVRKVTFCMSMPSVCQLAGYLLLDTGDR